VPLNKYLKFGEDNNIIISTDNRERFEDRGPGKGIALYLSGGIVGDVSLFATDKVYLEGARFAFAEPDKSGGTFLLKGNIVNTSRQNSKVCVDLRIADKAGKSYGRFRSNPESVEKGKAKVIELKGGVGGVKPWSPESPQLYFAEVTLIRNGKRVDRLTERFGFRKVEARNNRIHLNGKETFIKGISMHSGYGYYPSDSDYEPEILPCREALVRDLKLIKGLGCNYVRLGHVPRIAPELDLFDEMGLMCSVENNLHWWQNDYANRSWGKHEITDKHVKSIRNHTTRQFKKMILRDMNHPSVVCWSASNECRPDKKGVVDTIQASVRLARRLDPSRLATHVSAEWHSELGQDDFSCDDVISINSYRKDMEFWKKELALLRQRYPDKPIMVTEFGMTSSKDPECTLRIMQAMAGYLAGSCVYSFSGVVAQRYRAIRNKGRITRVSYGLFNRRREPTNWPGFPKSAELYRKFLRTFRVKATSSVPRAPGHRNTKSKKTDALVHMGLDQ